MESTALFLLWASFTGAGVAAAAYLAYAVQPWLARSASARARLATDPPAEVDVNVGVEDERPIRSAALGGAATLSAWIAAVLGVAGLVTRSIALNHAPYSNLFEFSMAFGIAIVLLYVLFEPRFSTRLAGAFVLPVAVGLYGSALAFPSQGQDVLTPALQSPTLLTIHVALMILAYAVLAVAFGGAVLHLVQGFPQRVADAGGRFEFLPSAERADAITYSAVLVGFPLLAAGIALGAFWANDAWGRYWGWDPKETAALATWLIFAVYIHSRGLRQLRGARSAWIVIAGFAAVLFTYLGVNLWISGLHSYAGV